MGRPVKGFILAAGLGTRLRPLSDRVAKPAMEFFGVPMAAHTLNSLAGAGVSDFIINLHHLPETVKSALAGHLPTGAFVEWSEERGRILGTGGAVMPWLGHLSDGFILANGDTYRDLDPREMMEFHAKAGALATLSVAPAPEGASAPLEISESGRIERFLDDKRPDYRVGRPMLFSGMHIFSGAAVSRFNLVKETSFCVNRQVNQKMVAEGLPVFGYWPQKGYFWSDLGTPQSYLEAHFSLLKAGRPPLLSRGRLVLEDETTSQGGKIAAPSWLGEGAIVKNGAVAGPFAVLGAGSVVGEGLKVSGCVAWGEVKVEKSAEKAILSGFEAVFSDGGKR